MRKGDGAEETRKVLGCWDRGENQRKRGEVLGVAEGAYDRDMVGDEKVCGEVGEQARRRSRGRVGAGTRTKMRDMGGEERVCGEVGEQVEETG